MKLYALLFSIAAFAATAQSNLKPKIDSETAKINDQVIEWRRDFHTHPELGNEEVRTAAIVAKHLKKLGFEVQEGIAVTGVVGILRGGKPGPVVALRADMDALPVTERVDVPFKSNATTTYNGQETGVMHACGHDSHVAMLMGVAEVLASMKADLKGTVKLFFQPAEEGVYSTDKPFGANAMILEGCMENPKVDAVFGLHINSQTPAGHITYRPGAIMAAVDNLNITLKGKQTHGAYPWSGNDPIVAASQIVMGLQTIVSRNVSLIENPAVVTVGAIHGGIRNNIISEDLKMIGTIRTLGVEQRELVHRRITEIAEGIGKSAGVETTVYIESGYPVTYNDLELTKKMVPSLNAAAGEANVQVKSAVMGAEDFSYYQQKAPGLFFFLGAMDLDKKPEDVAAHHTPDFYLNESGFHVGVKALSYLVVDYFEMNK
ncbi:MAG: amidohydrolase [Spirosomataceae bacterium]|jgi:amidohydrolase